MHIQIELALVPVPPRYSETLPALSAMYEDRGAGDTPYLRLAAALIRGAVEDINAAVPAEAKALATAISACEVLFDPLAQELARKTAARADDAHEARQAAIEWFNGADAAAPFGLLCQELGVRAHVMRAAVSKLTRVPVYEPYAHLDAAFPV